MTEPDQRVKARPSWAMGSVGLILLLMLGLAMLLWQNQGKEQVSTRPTPETATMEQQLATLVHPPGTQKVMRIAEAGPSEGDADCPPWYLAGESRTFTGPREPIRAFYQEPYQMIFFDEMKPMDPDDPYVIMGHSPAEWNIQPEQLAQAYIVYHLVPSHCVGEEHHHE